MKLDTLRTNRRRAVHLLSPSSSQEFANHHFLSSAIALRPSVRPSVRQALRPSLSFCLSLCPCPSFNLETTTTTTEAEASLTNRLLRARAERETATTHTWSIDGTDGVMFRMTTLRARDNMPETYSTVIEEVGPEGSCFRRHIYIRFVMRTGALASEMQMLNSNIN